MGVRIVGTGSYLPGPPFDRDRLRALLRRHPDGLTEALQERLLEETGIETRYIAVDASGERPSETNTSMAAAAGRRALEAAGWSASDVELLIVTTVVPDHLMPPTSTLVQEALAIQSCAELELSSNCTATYKALAIADGLIRSGRYRRALICSSQFVSFMGWPPWACPDAMDADAGQLRWIVSDGAGALALEAGEPDTGLRVWLDSMGVGKPSGMSVALGAADPDIRGAFARGAQHVNQNMQQALRQGFPLALRAMGSMFDDFKIDGASIDHFLPAVSSLQVAEKLRRRARERYGVREDAWRLNFTRVGYLGGPGMFVLLDELARGRALRSGDLVCATAEESSKWMAAGVMFRWNP